jgi:hypothetical protein
MARRSLILISAVVFDASAKLIEALENGRN